jgi:hypothetical protein
MKRIELTIDEQLLLAQVLERRVLDLEIEILHTDSAEFKARLKESLAELRQLQARVASLDVAMAA